MLKQADEARTRFEKLAEEASKEVAIAVANAKSAAANTEAARQVLTAVKSLQ